MEAFNIGSTALTGPAEIPGAVATARNRFFTALNQPLGSPTLPTGAMSPLQIAAVRAIEIGSAVAFQAGELLLLGAVRAANTAATTLSRTGSVPATIAATGASIASTVTAAATAIRTAVTTSVASTSVAPRRPSVVTQTSRMTKPLSPFGIGAQGRLPGRPGRPTSMPGGPGSTMIDKPPSSQSQSSSHGYG